MSVCVVVVLTSTFRCPEVGLDFSLLGVQRLDQNFHFEVSRGWIRIFIFRCPEVGLEFSLLGVQRFDHTLSFLLLLWLRLRCPRLFGTAIVLSLSIWDAGMMLVRIFFVRIVGHLAVEPVCCFPEGF